MLSRRSSTVLRADRHTTTRPGTELSASVEDESPMRCCSYCVTPSAASVARRQRREDSVSRERQRVVDATALIAQIEAFQAIYSDCTAVPLAEPLPLPMPLCPREVPEGRPATTKPKHVTWIPREVPEVQWISVRVGRGPVRLVRSSQLDNSGCRRSSRIQTD